MDNTSTYPQFNQNIEPLASQELDLNNECETLHLVEDALTAFNLSPDNSIVNRVLAYSKSYSHSDSKILNEGIGINLN